MIEAIIKIAGGLVVLGALVGFVRSMWRSPERANVGRGEDTILGSKDALVTHSADDWGHGGTDAGHGGH